MRPSLPLRTFETIDIRAPAGFDLEALNETIRQGLPEGVEMHVVGDPEAEALTPGRGAGQTVRTQGRGSGYR